MVKIIICFKCESFSPYETWEGIRVLDAYYLIYFLGTCYILLSEPL